MLVQRGSNALISKRPPATTSVVVRAVAEPSTKQPTVKHNGNGKPSEHFINVIPKTAWEKGIPPVMVRVPPHTVPASKQPQPTELLIN